MLQVRSTRTHHEEFQSTTSMMVHKEMNTPLTQHKQCYEQSHSYDSHWWNNDQAATQQPQATAQSEQASSSTTVPLIHIAANRIASTINAAQALQHNNKSNKLMVHSGAVTHVCPPWFSPGTTLHKLQQGEGPGLQTATDDKIKVYGYKRMYMINSKGQAIVIPLYVCDVAQPILSATRLAEQGFKIELSNEAVKCF